MKVWLVEVDYPNGDIWDVICVAMTKQGAFSLVRDKLQGGPAKVNEMRSKEIDTQQSAIIGWVEVE